MDTIDLLRHAELRIGDFMFPWCMMIFALGFIGATVIVDAMERLGLTRHIWHLPLFFVALAVTIGSLAGLFLAP